VVEDEGSEEWAMRTVISRVNWTQKRTQKEINVERKWVSADQKSEG
jgi:hypothetical protein